MPLQRKTPSPSPLTSFSSPSPLSATPLSPRFTTTTTAANTTTYTANEDPEAELLLRPLPPPRAACACQCQHSRHSSVSTTTTTSTTTTSTTARHHLPAAAAAAAGTAGTAPSPTSSSSVRGPSSTRFSASREHSRSVESFEDIASSPNPRSLCLHVPEDFHADVLHMRRHWHRLNRDVERYLMKASSEVAERLMEFNREWGFEEFDDEIYYPRTQKLVFSNRNSSKAAFRKISCQGQVLGSYLPDERAFVWSWADDEYSTRTSAAARFLYNFAKTGGGPGPQSLFTTPLIDCSEDLAQLLCTAVCELMGYDGVFRLATEERGQLFVAFNVGMKEPHALRPE